MRDGFLIQTLPFFTGALAFLPGCESKSPAVDPTATDATTEPATSSGTATDPTTTTADTSGTQGTSTSPTETSLTTAVDSSESGDPACGGGTCGAPVEDGWFGPTVIARLPPDAELPSCTPEYPNAGPTLLDGFEDPGPAICDCTCELQMAPNCNLSMTSYSLPNCSNWLSSVAVSANCSNVSAPGSLRLSSYGYGVGSCDETEIEEIPPVPWDATIRTCRVPENALACGDGGVCLPAQPAGFEDTWCMYKQGDHECPAGEYANKSLYWSGAEDTRECSNCTCGTAGTNCADAELMVFAGNDCEGDPIGTVGTNTCSNVVGLSVAGTIGAESPCPVTSVPEPMGAVVAQGEFTFCCTG